MESGLSLHFDVYRDTWQVLCGNEVLIGLATELEAKDWCGAHNQQSAAKAEEISVRKVRRNKPIGIAYG